MPDDPGRELLKAEHLTRHFKIGGTMSRRTLHAVDDVNFSIGQREIVALAGESGSGKSHDRPAAGPDLQADGGRDHLRGKAAVAGCGPGGTGCATAARCRWSSRTRSARSTRCSESRTGCCAACKLHRPELSAEQRHDEAARVFEVVGLGAEMLQRFPYELSGGQRQRVGFAQALATRPKLILADEPVSMLDVSIRIGLLNLMAKLRDEEGVSILYITHDIASARYVADRLIVMYAGPDRRVRADRGGAGQPEAPLYAAAAVRGARPAGAAGRGRRDRQGRAAEGDRPEPRLPVPLALPAGHRRHARHVTPLLAELLRRDRWPATWRRPAWKCGRSRHEARGDRRRVDLHAGARRRARPARAGRHGGRPRRPRRVAARRGRPGVGADHARPRAPARPSAGPPTPDDGVDGAARC